MRRAYEQRPASELYLNTVTTPSMAPRPSLRAFAILPFLASLVLRAHHKFLLMAGRTLAAMLLDEGIEIVAAVIVGDLVARIDCPDRGDQDLALLYIGLGVRPAGVIDVARDVLAARSIDGPTG